MLKHRILFICIGGGGSNIGQKFEENGYNVLFINTSNSDLQTIKGEHKIHIAGALGCNKDRYKGMEYGYKYHEHIANEINTKFPQQDLVYIIYTGGGGTGSGIGSILTDYLSLTNANKKYNVVFVIPNLEESIKALKNAAESFKETISIKKLNSLFVLDNNNYNKFAINNKFYELFDKLINISKADERGNIDIAELQTILTCQGSIILSDDIESLIKQDYKNNIFTKHQKGCKYIGFSRHSDSLNYDEIKKLFGEPVFDEFQGYNKTKDFIVVSGLHYPVDIIDLLVNTYRARENDIIPVKNTIPDIDIPELKSETLDNQEKPDNENISFKDLFAKYMKR